MVVIRLVQKNGGGLGGNGIARKWSRLLSEKELDVLEEFITRLGGMQGE